MVYVAMSLRDFIWATTKDIQDVATKKAVPAEQLLSQQIEPKASRIRASVEKEEEEAEKDILALIRKKTRRGDQAETDQDASRKRRKKERAKKVKHEQGRQLVKKVAGGREKNMAAVKTELPVMSSMDVPEAMTGSPIDVDEIGEPSERQGEVIDQRPYATE